MHKTDTSPGDFLATSSRREQFASDNWEEEEEDIIKEDEIDSVLPFEKLAQL